MRLVCPNCGAQYEVPDEVIPEAGRDVQCSNCGHTWFQAHPDDDRELEADLGRAVRDEEWTPPPPSEPDHRDTGDPAPAAQDEPAPSPPPAEAPDEADGQPEEQTAEAARRRQALDPDVADVLRQEAELEARARAAETAPLESQPDLGLAEPEELDEHEKRAREARDRMARMRGEPVPREDRAAGAAAAMAASGSRRDLLPDIDEINSTLRSASERRTSAVAEAEREVEPQERDTGRGGFRRGFLIMILLFALATLIYVYAPMIAEAVPQIAEPLSRYVEIVDGLRQGLNAQIAAGLNWLDSMASTASQGGDLPASGE